MTFKVSGKISNLQHMLKNGDASSLGLQEGLEHEAIDWLVGINLPDAQRDALALSIQKMSKMLCEAQPELPLVAKLFLEAFELEEKACDKLLQDFTSMLSRDGQLHIQQWLQQVSDSKIGDTPRLKRDWVSFSRTNPKQAKVYFLKFCENYQNSP